MKQIFIMMQQIKKINMAFYLKASINRGVIELDVCDMLKAKTNKSFIGH